MGTQKPTGAHVSTAGGVHNAPTNAEKIGARAFALFTKNQRQWKAPPIRPESARAFRKNMEIAGIAPEHVLPHDSYLINLGHPEDEKREKSFLAFVDELERCRQLGLSMLNFHPGSHLGRTDEKKCLDNIVASLDMAAEQVNHVKLVMENTAGQGSNVGYCLEHLQYILEHARYPGRMGICLDTCHLFASGYDIREKSSYEAVMEEFDNRIGFAMLCGMHLNDSKKPLGSRVDRHAPIGRGKIGADAFRFIMEDERIVNIPLILETPDHDLWPDEIKMLNRFIPPSLDR